MQVGYGLQCKRVVALQKRSFFYDSEDATALKLIFSGSLHCA